jgi:hypothetical protein
MWTSSFWRAVAERALSSFAWSLISVIGVGATDLLSVPWQGALSTAGLSALLSVLKSVTVNGVSGRGPSLSTERVSTPGVIESRGRHERTE